MKNEDFFSTEIHKTLLSEKRVNLNKWSDRRYLLIRRVNNVKLSNLPYFVCKFNIISVKILVGFLKMKIEIMILKFMQKCKGLRRVKIILKKNRELMFPDLKNRQID